VDIRTLNAHYARAVADGGLEPDEQNVLFDALNRYYSGQPWPRAGGTDATMQFVADLRNAMIATRWNLDLLTMA